MTQNEFEVNIESVATLGAVTDIAVNVANRMVGKGINGSVNGLALCDANIVEVVAARVNALVTTMNKGEAK